VLKQPKELDTKSNMAECYNDLISLFISVSYKSSVAYLSCLLIYVWFLYPFIPTLILVPWALIHIIYQILRFYLAAKYKDKKLSKAHKIKFQVDHILLAFVGGSMWGIGSILCVIYAPSPYEYIVLTLLVGMAAGAISTLSPIYRVYLAYNLPMLLLLLLAFVYKGDSLHFAIVFILVVFIIVVMSASWDAHKNLRRFVELKELYSQAQAELTRINASLEERVEKEVAYNRQKDKQMLEQSRLAQMGEMLSMIAHQWRQPLSAISATTGSMNLHMQLEKYDEIYFMESIDKINTYTQHLSTTITDFRNFFKPDKKKSLSNLNNVVMGSLNIIGSSLQSQGIKIETRLESTEEIYTYPNELMQVLLNIIKNAQDVFMEKAMYPSAKIKEPRIVIETQTLEDEIQLIIKDNAGGISQENFAYVFDPYFTTKEKCDGTGLGLYMSKMIVEDHCNGKLQVENEDDGACFILTLPRI